MVPLVLLNLITTNYPLLTTPFMESISEYITFYGGMIVAACTLEAVNKPGTYKRMLFGLSALAFICMWMFVVFGGGIAEFTYGPYHVRFDITSILYIMLFGISLKGLLVVQTFSSHRQIIRNEKAEKALEREEAARATQKPRKPARARSSSLPFSSMSKTSFEVTHDDAVGYSPPPPPSPTPASGADSAKVDPTARSKLCPVCGERVQGSASECPSCGAWFSKESFRFKRG